MGNISGPTEMALTTGDTTNYDGGWTYHVCYASTSHGEFILGDVVVTSDVPLQSAEVLNELKAKIEDYEGLIKGSTVTVILNFTLLRGGGTMMA